MSNYFTRKKLEKNIISLSDKKAALRKELRDVCKELEECYKKQIELKQIESVKIKFGDLLDELKQINESDITKIDLQALNFFASTNHYETINGDMKFFGSKLTISFENEEVLYYSGFHIFEDLAEIQADGKTLLEHCSLDEKNCNLVVDKNIEDVICHINLKGNHSVFDATVLDNDSLLEQAVYSLIDKNKVLDIEHTKEKEQVKQKKLTR